MMGRGAMSNSISELDNAPFLLVAGSNTTETHPIIALHMKQALRKGARMVVVDPRKIEWVSWAHRWLPVRVGTDIALFNAMAHVIIKERLYKEAYVRLRTAGFEKLQRQLERYTPTYAAEITGVSADDIIATAREYATAERAAIVYTLGITEHSCGVHNVQALANLGLLCGNLGIESAGVNPLRGQNNVQGAGDAGASPDNLPGYQKLSDREAVRRFEREWGVTLPTRPGVTKVTAIREVLKGRLRALWIIGENTVVSDARAGETRKALDQLEFLVVQDIFLTETARLAHVVLPAAAFAEVDGTFTNTERRVQRLHKAVEPPGEARPDWAIVCNLAQWMGYPLRYSHPSQIWDEMARNTPILAGISYDRLEKGGIQWPCPTHDHPGTPYLHKDTFATDKGYFQPVGHVPPAEPPDNEYPLVLTTGRRRATYHTGTQTGRMEGIKLLVPHEWVEVSPSDAVRLRIADEELVEVVSRRGRVTAHAKVTDRSPPGTIFMSFHFPQETPTNVLTVDAYDPITETAEFKACAVRIERIGGARD